MVGGYILRAFEDRHRYTYLLRQAKTPSAPSLPPQAHKWKPRPYHSELPHLERGMAKEPASANNRHVEAFLSVVLNVLSFRSSDLTKAPASSE